MKRGRFAEGHIQYFQSVDDLLAADSEPDADGPSNPESGFYAFLGGEWHGPFDSRLVAEAELEMVE